MPRNDTDRYAEIGNSGVPVFAGRFEERFLLSLRGPEGLVKMGSILRKESAAFTANRMVQLTAAESQWTVEPASKSAKDKKAAEFLESCMGDMSHSWDRVISFALSAQAFGFADQEIVLKRCLGRSPAGGLPSSEYDDEMIRLRKIAPRRQETIHKWVYDDHGGVQAIIQRDPTTFKELPPIPISNALHYIGGDDRGSWEGLGWLEPAYAIYHTLANLEIIDGIGWQRSLTGVPVFGYKAEPDATTKNAINAMGRGLVVNDQQFITYPANLVEFDLKTVTNTNAGALQNKIDRYRWEIMSLVLATFIRLGSTESGSRALSGPLIEFFMRGIDTVLDQIADVLNRHLVPRLFEANEDTFGKLKKYPKFSHTKIKTTPLELLTYLDKIVMFLERTGDPDALWLRQSFGMPEELTPIKPLPRPEPVITKVVQGDAASSGTGDKTPDAKGNVQDPKPKTEAGPAKEPAAKSK